MRAAATIRKTPMPGCRRREHVWTSRGGSHGCNFTFGSRFSLGTDDWHLFPVLWKEGPNRSSAAEAGDKAGDVAEHERDVRDRDPPVAVHVRGRLLRGRQT